jgi:ATP-dependent Clp protease ATP-binding subunit ClpC
MIDEFKAFGEQARHVMAFAHEEGQRRRHNTLTTEHLLIGLMDHVQGNAMLAALNVPVPRGGRTVPLSRQPAGPVPPLELSPEAQRVVELAREEINDPDLRGDEVGLEHLLVALVREEGGAAGRKLREYGLTPERIRMYVVISAIRAAQKIETGAELRIWGTQEDMDRLIDLSSRLSRPIDDLAWEAIQRTWFADRSAVSDVSNTQ